MTSNKDVYPGSPCIMTTNNRAVDNKPVAEQILDKVSPDYHNVICPDKHEQPGQKLLGQMSWQILNPYQRPSRKVSMYSLSAHAATSYVGTV